MNNSNGDVNYSPCFALLGLSFMVRKCIDDGKYHNIPSFLREQQCFLSLHSAAREEINQSSKAVIQIGCQPEAMVITGERESLTFARKPSLLLRMQFAGPGHMSGSPSEDTVCRAGPYEWQSF